MTTGAAGKRTGVSPTKKIGAGSALGLHKSMSQSTAGSTLGNGSPLAKSSLGSNLGGPGTVAGNQPN